MRRPIITLITDFGLSDHYAGVMRGVILGICPQAEIVDISHEVGAYEVVEGAFLLAQTYPYFPRGTVHVVVIDPGVGTARRPIVAEAAGQRFVAPDNGVLSMMYAREKPKARWITAEKYFLKPVSQTFHGRDIFAPVGAHLARGIAPAKMGKQITDYLRLHFERPVRTARRAWTGAVLKIDRFGNLVTNFPAEEFPDLQKRPFEMSIGLETVNRLARNYAESGPGQLFVIVGSSGYLEVSASQASAAKMLGCGVGAPVELRIL
ncbi:MAG TPA: SAM-dependent chlorinase/fluorinase [Bryobacteraceae bacterium]|nr:SAM-dependent chlorinase/fluorinase [Bryobacteraceae bacterium]